MTLSILNTKKVVLLSFTFVILSLAIMPLQSSFAASRTVSVVADNTITITYRDFESLDTTPEPVASLDKTSYANGDTAILTIDDFNADLDVTEIDTTTALVNSQTVVLTETDINSHVFVGSFTVQGNVGLIYAPDPVEAPRAQVTLGVDDPGDIIISDHIFDQNELENLPFTPVTHALDVELANGATLDGTNAIVKLSYANADLDGVSSGLLQMYYKPGPDFGWSVITLASDSGANNQDDEFMTSDPEFASFCCPVTTGQYVLGFETGSSGGGGGGLIRPGLVLNLLAGIPGLGGGVDVSAPSLHFGDSTSTQDGFGGILVTDDNNNAFPLVINGKGYYLPAFSTFIEPVQVNTGQDVDLTLTFLESTGVEHVAMHLVDVNNDELSDTDAVITFDKGTVTKSDPQGILADDITFSKTKEGNKYSFNFGFSFDKPTKQHLMITAWDDNKNSGNAKVFNAFTVSGEPIPDEGISHMIYLDLGAYFITANGIFAAGEKTTVAQPVIAYEYPDSVGRTERHDAIIYDNIAGEKARATQVMSEKFNLDTTTFVQNDEVKPYDTSKRASELSLSSVGHKLRDNTMSPEENAKLIKQLSWQEHLKAQKILDSLLASSKYHQ